MKEIVAKYATKDSNGVEVNLELLAQDKKFYKAVVKAVKEIVIAKPRTCVLLPSYNRNVVPNNLGLLVNEIAATLVVKTIVTGSVSNLKRIKPENVKNVLIIKRAFLTGAELRKQISELQKMGSKVRVLCFIAQTRASLEAFAKQTGAEISAMLYTEDI